MTGINPILAEIQELSKVRGYITERELSRILVEAKLPRLLISAVYEELDKMKIRIMDKDIDNDNSDAEQTAEITENTKGRDTRLQERVQKYRDRNEELNSEDGRKIIDEFYLDLSKPRMQYSYFPLIFLAFFDRRHLTVQISMYDLIQYFRNFYQNREEQGLIVEKRASIFVKGSPTDSEIKRLILFNPLGRSCLVKYFRYNKGVDAVFINENMYQALTGDDIDKIIDIANKMIESYYDKLNLNEE